METGIKNLNFRNAGAKNEQKSSFNNKKQRYWCKACSCHYTVSPRGYPEHIKRKAIPLYLEGNGFRRIERILKVSHVSVINWVKKVGAKLEKLPKKEKKAEVLELDELCVKKQLYLDHSRPRHKAGCWLSNRNSRNKILPKTHK